MLISKFPAASAAAFPVAPCARAPTESRARLHPRRRPQKTETVHCADSCRSPGCPNVFAGTESASDGRRFAGHRHRCCSALWKVLRKLGNRILISKAS